MFLGAQFQIRMEGLSICRGRAPVLRVFPWNIEQKDGIQRQKKCNETWPDILIAG